MECKTCASLAGTHRISPGEVIHNGEYWVLEHTYPVKVRGWLVLVLKRHAAALHELTSQEFSEFQELTPKIVAVLHAHFSCTKEYVLCLAEAPGYEHVHVHFIPRAADLPAEFRGSRIFGLIGVADPLPQQDVIELCTVLQRAF